MATVPARLTNRTDAQRWRDARDEDALWGDLRPELLEAVKAVLEETMEDELGALLRARPYERTHLRLDVHNGACRCRRRASAGSRRSTTPRSRPATASRSTSRPGTCWSTAYGSRSGAVTGGAGRVVLAAYGFELVTADGAGGIAAAVAKARLQRCWTQYADLPVMPTRDGEAVAA